VEHEQTSGVLVRTRMSRVLLWLMLLLLLLLLVLVGRGHLLAPTLRSVRGRVVTISVELAISWVAAIATRSVSLRWRLADT